VNDGTFAATKVKFRTGHSESDEKMEEKLSQFLKSGSDWSRMKTSIPGVFVLKMPPFKSSPSRLAVELNPVDESGVPTKKRGLLIRSAKELERYKTLFQFDKLVPLLRTIDALNPSAVKRETREVIEL
jgi:hypothetical protein